MKPSESLTWEHVRDWRVQRHHLHCRAPRGAMTAIAAELGGLQAQVMSSAELALWARVENLRPDAVQRALWEDRTLVKTWAMRGTLHLLPSSELELWQSVPKLERHYQRPAWQRYFGISPPELDRLTDAIAEALDGQILTREELVEEVSALLGSQELGAKLRHSWGMMLKPAAYRCRLCFAPSVGQSVRFTRPDRWLARSMQVDETHAEREVTRRFLAAYGPVSREVFGQWLGVAISRAGSLISALGDEATPVDVEGKRGWVLTSQLDGINRAKPSGSVRLLPAFDQYVLTASRDAPSFMPGPFRGRIYRTAGWLSPVLLVDGRMDGVWKYERKGSRLLVQVEPFEDQPGWVREAAEGEAQRLAAFMNRRLELTWS